MRKKEICYWGVYIDQRESGESDDKPGEGGGGGGVAIVIKRLK